MPNSVDLAVDLMLGPATRLLWRAPDSVHLELGTRAVVVDGLPPELTARLAARGRTASAGSAVDLPGVTDAFATLTDSGYLWSRPASTDGTDGRSTPPVPRLAPELAALAVRHGERAAELLDARRHASVAVCGSDRLGVQLAALLAAAGVGHVDCAPEGSVRLQHAGPGGVLVTDEGLDLTAAAHRAINRAAPEANTAGCLDRPDLTVLVTRGPIDDTRRDALLADGAAHLAVTTGPDHGVVGPLVLPGLTSCLHCADLHRCERDPAWPALAVQLSVPPRYAPPSAVAVTALTAALAATQCLAFLDGDDPACVEATLELRLPDWRVRRRRWPVHPDCGCCAG